MSACTFFGHRDCPDDVKELIRLYLIGIIENQGIDTFYVGNQGDFDRYVIEELRKLAVEYPHIKYTVVLAYHPSVREVRFGRPEETMFPDELCNVHPRFAIEKRNRWMLDNSQVVMSYVLTWGGAMKFMDLAKKQKKQVINLAELEVAGLASHLEELKTLPKVFRKKTI